MLQEEFFTQRQDDPAFGKESAPKAPGDFRQSSGVSHLGPGASHVLSRAPLGWSPCPSDPTWMIPLPSLTPAPALPRAAPTFSSPPAAPPALIPMDPELPESLWGRAGLTLALCSFLGAIFLGWGGELTCGSPRDLDHVAAERGRFTFVCLRGSSCREISSSRFSHSVDHCSSIVS